MTNVESRLEKIYENGYEFRLMDYINRGFNIFGKKSAFFIGFFIIQICIGMFLGAIPHVGQIVSWVISGALTAGYYIVADKTDRDEYLDFSNFFDGFKLFSPLFLCSLISFVLVIVAFIPLMIYFFTVFRITEMPSTMEIPYIVKNMNYSIIIGYMFLVGLIVLMFSYAPLFVIFDKMGVMEANIASVKIAVKNFGYLVLFLILWICIMGISALPCGLGLLVTLPAFYCSIYAAWSDITGYNPDENIDESDDILRHLID